MMKAARYWATARFACLLAAALLMSGCAGRSINGYFVSSSGINQIVMAHIVEAPRGHLSGAIEVTTVNPAGIALNVSDYNVDGSIAGRNVSLKVTGAPATIAGWFSGGNILVGSLDGGRLTLSRGSQTLVFEQMSEAGYQVHIQKLQQIQSHAVALRNVAQDFARLKAYVIQLKAAIKQYRAWGDARISNQKNVRAAWAGRLKFYSACLAQIEPLARAHVPSWRWQNCVLNVENDAYDRRQELNSVQENAAQEPEQSAHVNTMIDQDMVVFHEVTHRLHLVCPYAPHPRRCDAGWKKLKAREKAMEAERLAVIAQIHAFEHQVGQAIKSDVEISTSSNARLEAISSKVEQIYKGAST